jgi:quercetin dioxygenase-like cupin family protein
VLSGTIEFFTEEYSPVTLNPGDSCYLDSTMRHAFVTKSEEDARILSIFISTPQPATALTKPGE